ncbi:MAG: hypothetical protein MUO37_04715, partial [Methyloceanibacter sp.]|nr:hypothetical protein [Methyloceanibacter sp.]
GAETPIRNTHTEAGTLLVVIIYDSCIGGFEREQQSIRQALPARFVSSIFLLLHQDASIWQRFGNTYHALECAATLSYALEEA